MPKGVEHEHTQLDPSRSGATAGLPANSAAAGPPDLRALGEYRILRRLGEGGMGAVYLGYDGKHDRQVALKVLNEGLASNQSYVDRFYREAKSGGLLHHPNIVRTLNVGQDLATRKHYLVLEYVDGPSAQFLLQQRGKLSVGDAVHVALDVARGLEHAHSRNIVHRDIKPDNILITRSGVAKLGDLGLAKRIDDPSHLTGARQGFGTTAYMPYEQAINARHADGRSDIYALGATLYHLVTGHVPFPGENHLEVMEKKNQGYYRPASALEATVPPGLDLILGKMLARQPRDRYQTASELIIDLERSRLGVPVPSFADPELARRDPWLQSWINTAEPTRLDPETPPVSRTPPEDPAAMEWIVRYRNRAGRSFTTRLDTEHLIERLQEGTLPADAVARRADEEEYQPLSAFAELREHIPALEAGEEPVLSVVPVQSSWLFYELLAGAALLAAVIIVLTRWLLGP
jgi:serine/threonine-protein kinase